MIIYNYEDDAKGKFLSCGVGQLVFKAEMNSEKLIVNVYDYDVTLLNTFYVYLSNNTVVLEFAGDGLIVSFKDNSDFIKCMECVFDDCPAGDIKTIFDTMFYID